MTSLYLVCSNLFPNITDTSLQIILPVTTTSIDNNFLWHHKFLITLMGEDDQGYHNIVTGNSLLNSPNDTLYFFLVDTFSWKKITCLRENSVIIMTCEKFEMMGWGWTSNSRSDSKVLFIVQDKALVFLIQAPVQYHHSWYNNMNIVNRSTFCS